MCEYPEAGEIPRALHVHRHRLGLPAPRHRPVAARPDAICQAARVVLVQPGHVGAAAPVNSDIAARLRRMQPRCQRYRGGSRAANWRRGEHVSEGDPLAAQ